MISCLISASVFAAFVVWAVANPNVTVSRINREALIRLMFVRFMRLNLRPIGQIANEIFYHRLRTNVLQAILDRGPSAFEVCARLAQKLHTALLKGIDSRFLKQLLPPSACE